jgi:hypothetical protein
MRKATVEERLHWDELVALNPDGGNILQTAVYGQFKKIYGWRSKQIIHELDGVTIATQYLVHNVPGLGPKAPESQPLSS